MEAVHCCDSLAVCGSFNAFCCVSPRFQIGLHAISAPKVSGSWSLRRRPRQAEADWPRSLGVNPRCLDHFLTKEVLKASLPFQVLALRQCQRRSRRESHCACGGCGTCHQEPWLSRLHSKMSRNAVVKEEGHIEVKREFKAAPPSVICSMGEAC